MLKLLRKLFERDHQQDNILQPKIDAALEELRERARERKGGAYTTTSCVVGSDMETGIHYAQGTIAEYDFDNGKTVSQQCAELESILRKEADLYSGRDSEGYVAGTIGEVGVIIGRLSS